MKDLNPCVYSILLILIIINTALSITEVSSVAKPVSSSAKALMAEELSGTSVATSPPIVTLPSAPSDGGPSRQPTQVTVTTSSPEDPIKIVKTIMPRQKSDSRQVGKIARITIEIYSRIDKDIKFNIREFIDENLSLLLPSIHGYRLANLDQISYYKLYLLDDLEFDRSNLTQIRNYDYICFTNHNYNIRKDNLIGINYDPEDKIPYLLDDAPLFNWTNMENGSLRDCLLRNFIKDKLQIVDDESSISNLTINRIGNNIIEIMHGNETVIEINRVNNKLMDNGYVTILYNNTLHHLKIKNDNVFDINNTLAVNNISLHPNEVFVFWYDIMPESPGIYCLETVASVINPKRIVSSSVLIESMKDEPQFEVTREFGQFQVYKGKTLWFNYMIKYLGGGSKNGYINAKCALNKSDYYDITDIKIDGAAYEFGDKYNITLPLKKDVDTSLRIETKFKEMGDVSPPRISIEGNYYPFNESITVTVDTPVRRDFNLISLFLTAIAFLFLFLIKELYLDTNNASRISNKQALFEEMSKRIFSKYSTQQNLFLFIISFFIIAIILSILTIIALSIISWIIYNGSGYFPSI